MRKALLILPAVAAALTLSACGQDNSRSVVDFTFRCAAASPNSTAQCSPTDEPVGNHGSYVVISVPFECGPEWHNPTGYSDTVSCHSK
jgi:hypothetical protein